VSAAGDSLAVVVCTVDRPEKLSRTVDALEAQSDADFDLVVVDQSERPDDALESRASSNSRIRLIHDRGRGASRARNLGWRAVDSDWVAFIDDDCVAEPNWVAELRRAISAHPEASFVSGEVLEGGGQEFRVAAVEVPEERVLSGRRLRPDAIGLGVHAVRRSWLDRLGGFDERLGPGIADFPAGEDVDFNYRFLQQGGVAFITPMMRVVHEQWRPEKEELRTWRGYYRGWAAFTVKQLRGGDVAGALRLWLLGLRVIAGVAWGGIKRRSAFQLRRAASMMLGLLSGGFKAATRGW
jgi:GT2 family glycosyltransferase